MDPQPTWLERWLANAFPNTAGGVQSLLDRLRSLGAGASRGTEALGEAGRNLGLLPQPPPPAPKTSAYPLTPGGVAGYEAGIAPRQTLPLIMRGASPQAPPSGTAPGPLEGMTDAEIAAALAGYAGIFGGPPYMAQLAEEQRQFDLTQQWLREQLAAQQAMEQQALAQRQREMAAAMGQTVANLQSRQWAEALPMTLPKGTMFAPGYGMGGPVHQMAQRAGMTYQPTPMVESPPPSREEMEAWLEDTIRRFARGGM